MPSMGMACTQVDIIAFHHAAMFSPAMSTLMTALTKGFIPPLPKLTVPPLSKCSPNLEATTMGHLENKRNTSSPHNQKGYNSKRAQAHKRMSCIYSHNQTI
jgi:hypothetical protein